MIRDIIGRVKRRLELKKANVIGFAEGKDEITYFVTRKLPESVLNKRHVISKSVAGKRTQVEEREIPKACAAPKIVASTIYRTRTRPFQPGQSIGNAAEISAGTLGIIGYRTEYTHPSWGRLPYWVGDLLSAKFLLKSGVQVEDVPVAVTNRHVAGETGSKVLQPGKLDGGNTARDKIGDVIQYGLMRFNPLDISIIKLTDSSFKRWPVNMRSVSSGIKINRSPPFGLVKKSGRTSGLTYGSLARKDVRITVDMGSLGMIEFSGVYEVDMEAGQPMLLPGDSGSSVWDTGGGLIGFGFAAGSRYSYVIPVGRVLDEFNITL